MKRKYLSLLLALCLSLIPMAASAAGSRVESLEYKGFGILKLEFTADCDWYDRAEIRLVDGAGDALNPISIGGEADDCYLRAANLVEGETYALHFALDGVEQEINFECVSGVEYRIGADGGATPRTDDDRCDFCGEQGHDDDFCPARVGKTPLPDDPDALARLFDLDRCERCGGIGHDDDHCERYSGSDHHDDDHHNDK